MEPGENSEVEAAPSQRTSWRIARMTGVAVLAALLFGFLILWFMREDIAEDVIGDQLVQYDLPATYEIESVGPAKQVVRNIVVGDPSAPDLTIERAVVNLRYRLGFPAIGRVELTKPRLYGRVDEQGSLSFGTLDRVIFAESDQPPALPDLDILLEDARGRIDTPWGAIGLKAEGEGELDDGFSGSLAALTENFSYEGCALERVSVFGELSVTDGEPSFEGPLRVGNAQCASQGLTLASADLSLKATGDATLDGVEVSLGGDVGRFAFADGAIVKTRLTTDAAWRDGRIVARFDAGMEQPSAAQIGLVTLDLSGSLRSDAAFQSLQSEIEVNGEGLTLDSAVFTSLEEARSSAEGTLAAPLLAKLTAAMRRQLSGAGLTTELTVRSEGSNMTVVAPRTSIRAADGTALAAISRLQAQLVGAGVPQLSGNVAIGGGGLPQVQGRMERDSSGNAVFRLQMAPYEAEGSRLAFSDLELRQSRSGAITLSGAMQADGPLPGGEIRGLSVPLAGTVAANGAFTMWRSCTPITFDRFSYFNLNLNAEQLILCPQSGAPILRYDARGMQFAAGAAGLDLSGDVAGSPLTLASGAVGVAWPGVLVAKDVSVVLGNEGSAARFEVPEILGELGDTLSGEFRQATIGIDPVPLDIFEASGTWAYEDSVLTVADGQFRVEDREEEQRFNPLYVRGADLVLVDNVITATGALREQVSDRIVTRVDIQHDLTSGAGFADLSVDSLVFDSRLQPATLTDLAIGLVALADGTITGNGRVDWTNDDLSSRGRFATEGLDFAAPFGPVTGASGEIEFTDLLALTTAPSQKLYIDTVNPGIEADDGVITYQLTNGTLLELLDGKWPWLGGTLDMRSARLDFSQPEERIYVFDIEGLDAALFVERLEMGNLAATGIFDGTVTVRFDETGDGFIEDSTLIARPPGGNLSYVGELTYEDMGAIANFAFQSLRSLNFREMRVGVDGPLAGEVLTRIRFEGVSQGEGATSNIVTRQIAKLPIRFNVNVRAPFYQLLNNMRSLYDPEYVQDPFELGLIKQADTPKSGDESLSEGQPPIQDPESEDTP